MRSIRFIAIAGLAAAVGVSAGQASQLVKPIPRPVIEAYANWEELRVARGWPTREAAAKLSSAKRIEIATAALTAPHREVRNVEYGFDLLLSGPPSRDATRLLAKAILMNDYNFGRKAPGGGEDMGGSSRAAAPGKGLCRACQAHRQKRRSGRGGNERGSSSAGDCAQSC
jgi:hypothetical protein